MCIRDRHSSSWVFIKRDFLKAETSFIYIYKAADVIDVKLQGLKKEPWYKAEYPLDWIEIFSLTIP